MARNSDPWPDRHDGYDPASAEEFRRLPPHDIQAERWCLGGMITAKESIGEVAALLTPDDFYRPAHGLIYAAILRLWGQGIEADPITLKAELEDTGDIGRVGGAEYVFELFSIGSLATATMFYATRIRELAGRRKVLAVGQRVCQRVQEVSVDLAELVTTAQADIARAVMEASAVTAHGDGLMDIDAFDKQQAGRRPPVIPGLLDHQDRMVLCALEGDGKTTLGNQVAFGAAAGIHPFVPGSHFVPQRVCIVDLETPRYLVQQRVARMRSWVEAQSRAWHPANVTLLSLPGGVDLTKSSDAMRLADTIRLAAPDLVFAGPVYKMMVDRGQGAEELHSQVAAFWDMVRERYNPAVWLETHAPGPAAGKPRELYPYGWSGWRRWPEFGRTMQRGKKGEWSLGFFRGDREEGRMWPETLRRSTAGRTSPPWAAAYPAGTFQGRLDDDGRDEWSQ